MNKFKRRIWRLLFSEEAERKAKKARYMKEYWKDYHSKKVSCTLSEYEYVLIESHAKNQGITVASCLKLLALHQLNNTRPIPSHIEDQILGILRLLKALGNNLNQIAMNCNRLQKATNSDLKRAILVISEMQDDWKKFMKSIVQNR